MSLELKSAHGCFSSIAENIKIAIPVAHQKNIKNPPPKKAPANNKKTTQPTPSYQISTQYDNNPMSEYSFSGKQPKTETIPGSVSSQVKVPSIQEQIILKQRQMEKIRREIEMLRQRVPSKPTQSTQTNQPAQQSPQSNQVTGPVNYWSPESVKNKPGMGWGLGNWVRNIKNIPSNFMSGLRGTSANSEIIPKTSSAEYLIDLRFNNN